MKGMKTDRTLRFIRQGWGYAWRIPVAIGSVLAVATVQHLWVLQVPHLEPVMYIIPLFVGTTFGVLWSVIAFYRDRFNQQRRLMMHLAEDSHDVLVLRTQSRFLFLSPRIEDLTGYPAEVFELTPGFWEQLVYPEDQERWARHQEKIWSERAAGWQILDFRLVTPMKGVFWVRHEATCFEQNGEWVCRCVLRDISLENSLKEALEQLRHLDVTTQLPNRAALMACLVENASAPLSGIIFDVENLKRINVRFRVEVGDAVLRGLAERLILLQQQAPEVLCVARWVGDNLVVVYQGSAAEAETWLVQHLGSVLEQPVFYEKGGVLVDIRLRHYVFSLLQPGTEPGVETCYETVHQAYVALHREI